MKTEEEFKYRLQNFFNINSLSAEYVENIYEDSHWFLTIIYKNRSIYISIHHDNDCYFSVYKETKKFGEIEGGFIHIMKVLIRYINLLKNGNIKS